MTLISTTSELSELCARLAAEPFITIDTEFIRERTYYPQLCLIQVAGADEAVAIDPLAKGLDLAPLYTLLQNTDVLKVFHACSQDMEIFYYATGTLPTPVFDTQVAAMVCGYGESVGYETLVNKLLNQTLDKSSRFTDWARRPLTDKQMAYALSDVIHLRDIYAKLHAELDATGRMGWIAEEMRDLSAVARYAIDPDTMWMRLRHRSRAPKFLGLLRAIAAWRERVAQEKNMPRMRVLKDDVILEIAAQAPTTLEELKQVRGITHMVSARRLPTLLAAMTAVYDLPVADLPTLPAPRHMPPGRDGIMELLRVLLKIKAESDGVAQKLIADRDDLERFVCGETDVPFLHGWRYDMFGKHAEALCAGTLALTYDPKSKIVKLLNS